MKKCSKCNYKTSNPKFNICPICGEKLYKDNTKQKYTMVLAAEQDYSREIEMIPDEAKIVDRVLNELNQYSEGYCGRCYIIIPDNEKEGQ